MNLGAAIEEITLEPSLSACIMKQKGEDEGKPTGHIEKYGLTAVVLYQQHCSCRA